MFAHWCEVLSRTSQKKRLTVGHGSSGLQFQPARLGLEDYVKFKVSLDCWYKPLIPVFKENGDRQVSFAMRPA